MNQVSQNRNSTSGGAEVEFRTHLPVGSNPENKGSRWVQTDRKAHEEWGRLAIKRPAAAAVLHHLIALMQHKNAVVVSQKTLAAMIGITDRSVRAAIADLEAQNWVQIIRIGKGRETAFVVNDRVAWGEARANLRLSTFSAEIVANCAEQTERTLSREHLRKIPTLYPGEHQLPSGPGEAPPSQPFLPDMELDLPALTAQEDQ